jgi:hypothetical protein
MTITCALIFCFFKELTGVTTESVVDSQDSFASTIAVTLNVSQDSVTINEVTNASSSTATALRKQGLSLTSSSSAAVLVDYGVLTSNASNAATYTTTLNSAVSSGQLLADLQAASATFAQVTAVSAASYEGVAEVYNTPAPSSSSPPSASPTLITVVTEEKDVDSIDVKLIVFVVVIVAGLFLILVLSLQHWARIRRRNLQQEGVAMSGVGMPSKVSVNDKL